MINEALARDIDKIISCMDSFQQDHGELRFNLTVQSYAQGHRLTVNVFKTDEASGKSRAITFCVEDTNFLYETFSKYVNKLYEEG